MLYDLNSILDRASGKEAETLEQDLRATTRALWDRQFIYGDDHGGAKPYDLGRRYRAYFESLFDAMGYDFLVEERERLIGIVDQAGAAPRAMRWDETLFLLALRIVYEERVRSFDIKDRGRCDTALSEVWTMIEERTMRKRPSITRCVELVRRFQRHGLVRFLDDQGQDAALEIRPAIRLAMGEATLEALLRYTQAPAAAGSGTADPSERSADDLAILDPDDGEGDPDGGATT